MTGQTLHLNDVGAVRDPSRETTGYRPSEIASQYPDEALDLMRRAEEQLAHHGRQGAVSRMKADLMNGSPSTSVEDGIETTEDRQVAATKELIETIRDATGQSVDAEVPPFDPSFEVPKSREEVEDPSVTVGEFRRSVLTEDEKSLKSDDAWTTEDGQPLTLDEATKIRGTDSSIHGLGLQSCRLIAEANDARRAELN